MNPTRTLSRLTVAVAVALGAPIVAANPQPDDPRLRSGQTLDGFLYSCSVRHEDILRTGREEAPPNAIGLPQSIQLAEGALTAFVGGDLGPIVVHAAQRKRVPCSGGPDWEPGSGWLYIVSFVEKGDRIPDAPSSQFQVFVLYDGTVGKIARRPNPARPKADA